MRPHKLTNVVVLASTMLLAGAASAVLGLAMRFNTVSLMLIAACFMVTAGLVAALILYRHGMTADSGMRQGEIHRETPAT